MFETILIVSNHSAWTELIKLGLAEISHREILTASNCREAKLFESLLPDLIVADLNLPADADGGLDTDQWLGLGLLETWHETGKCRFSILLSDIDDGRIVTRYRLIDRCELLQIQGSATDIARDIDELAHRLIRRSASAQPSRVITTIDLRLYPGAGNMGYVINIHEDGSVLKFANSSETIRFDKLEQFVALSRAFDPKQNWHLFLRNLGEQLFEHLITGTCRERYRYAMGRCAGAKNLRLRLEAQREFYPVAFEALYDTLHSDFLMLDAAIARCVPEAVERSQSSRSQARPINILVIVSDVGPNDEIVGPGGEVWKPRGKGGQPEKLKNLAGERSYFESISQKGDLLGIGKVKILPEKLDGTAWSLADSVEFELKGRADPSGAAHYDIIHFAGHSDFAHIDTDTDKRGFLLFAGKPKARAVPVSTFATWLSGAGPSFVYFSSCRSSSAEAAFEMARAGVPAVLGFRWDLDDEKAVDFAERFYDNLLGHFKGQTTRKLCFAEAFTQARRQLRDEHQETNWIWAAPILIMQKDDWHQAHVHQHASGHRTLARAGQ